MDYDTNDIDFERAAMLLSVVKDCAGVGPQLTAIGAAAMHELVDMNKDLADRQANAGKEKLRVEAEQKAEFDARAQIGKKHDELMKATTTYPSNQDETGETNDVRRI